ncbi:MAG TPA: VWA domain-containing protein, partial [Planctomycetota bacterium]|nr:VWA domain-containing protein [Planctomycetota bacterium]
MDRILLWIILFSPILVMAASLIVLRYQAHRGAKLKRDLFGFSVLATVMAAWVAYDFWGERTGATAHLHLQRPWLLALLIPAYALLLWLQIKTLSGISRGRMWTAFLLRSAIIILLFLAVAGLQMVIEKDALRVLFALDVSKSVPVVERQRALEFIRKTLPQKKADDEAGLIVFGGKPALEKPPSKLPSIPDAAKLKSVTDSDATDIERALRSALNSFDEDSRRRLVLFTDGRQTSGDASEELKRLVSMGVDVWVVPLSRGNDAEVLIEKIVLPNELLWEQPFDCHVFVFSNITTKARVRLYLGDKGGPDPQPEIVELTPGKNRVSFKGLKMRSGGAKEVRAIVEPLDERDQLDPTRDTLTENNEAFAFTDVATDCRILIMTSDVSEVKHLVSKLEGEKMTIDVRSGASIPENPEAFRAYDCIVLANLARPFLSPQQMSVIESCVKDQGAGLVMIGGEQSFGAGGYLHTPIEEALPVQMDLQNQRVMPSGALNIVLHTCEFGEGNAWGKKISKAAINVLSPQDYAGLLYFDHTAMPGEQWCFKPSPVSRKQWMFGLIDACNPGDMPTLDPIVAMAVQGVANLKNVSLKHCIIITDGDPQPPSAATLAAAKNGKVTVSVITIFPHGGGDVSVMKDLAAQTGGRYYSADDPKKLPQIFIKEAAVVRKSLIR